ncbi:MAG: hypothetical protein KDA80_20380, partial [Planctomycetaceae bacterium]|nr:hypothetical protein [Planctomycetaceae bacterium]
MNATNSALLSVFAVIGLGLVLGRVSIKGFSLGTSGVIFVGILAGQFGFSVPKELGTGGIVLFVYCLGIGAGPSFLQVLRRRGQDLFGLAILMLLAAVMTAWLVAVLLNL